MDIKLRIKRTWQQSSFEPITIDVEVTEFDSTDFDKTYHALYEKAESAIVESEMKLRDMYSPEEDTSRKAKNRTTTRKRKK